jgi:hypothetical protein
MNRDCLSIIRQYCDDITTVVGLIEFYTRTTYVSVDANIEKRPRKRRKQIIDTFHPNDSNDRLQTQNHRYNEEICKQFAGYLKPYLRQHYDLDDEWWSIVTNHKGYLSGSFLLHFLHGEPERAGDLDFFFLDSQFRHINESNPDAYSYRDHGTTQFIRTWADKHGYQARGGGEELLYAHAAYSNKYWKNRHCINIVAVNAPTLIEYICLFDLAFLSNMYDGQSLTIMHLEDVLTKSSDYKRQLHGCEKVYEAHRFLRCVKYMQHGYTIRNFCLPTVVIHLVDIKGSSVVSHNNNNLQKRMLQWIYKYNQCLENAHRKIVVRLQIHAANNVSADDLFTSLAGMQKFVYD